MKPILINVNSRMIDIRHATDEEKEIFYINSTHGMVTDVIDELLEQLIEYEIPFSEAAAEEIEN